MDIDLTKQLIDQLDWHWQFQARARLDGLTDDEYGWEPVEGCWSVRPRGTSSTPQAAGSGDFLIDYAVPEPKPAPVTTISWRLGHIIVGVLGTRVHNHFGGPKIEYADFAYAGTAGEALKQLDEGYDRWIAGVKGMDAERLAEPCGPAEGPYADFPKIALVLHINREMIHHLAEVALMRDLYLRR